MAIKSSLATSDVQAARSNYTVGRSGQTVRKITIHHAVMAKASARSIANIFVNPNRAASANYCIGYTRGDICCSLYEENRAWTSSSGENDRQAITMEVANSSTAYPYPVSDDTLANIIDLCVDICKRYNFRLTWTGDKNGSLTVHRMFAATACPGDYLMGKMQYIADEVNKRLDGSPSPAPAPTPTPSGGYETYTVVKGDCLSIIGQKLGVNWKDIASLNNIPGPKYTIYVGQVLKIRQKSTPTPATKSIDEIAREVIRGDWGNGDDRKKRLTEAGYNYSAVQSKVNELLGGGSSSGSSSSINVGDTVIVNGIGKATASGTGASTKNFSGTKAKVVYTKPGAAYPYALNCNNSMNGVTGWFKASAVRK